MKKAILFFFALMIVSSGDVISQIWQTVGAIGFSTAEADFPSLAIDGNNVPYVAYKDDFFLNNGRVTVKKFNGADWVTVGSEGFSANAAYYISIAIDGNNVPYVSYMDFANGSKATVKKFNGSAWVTVGTAGFSAGSVNTPSIAIDGSNVPYVVYRDFVNSDKATVMKFNGTDWETVGSAGFSLGVAYYTSIAIDNNNVPYVVYRDNGSGQKVTVMKYIDNTWQTVGSAGFSSGVASYTKIAFDNDNIPYVAYQDMGYTFKAVVKKFYESSWQTVGNAGISAGQADYISIAINRNNVPFIAYRDNLIDGKAVLKRLSGNAWVDVGIAGFSNGLVYYTSLALDSNNVPYVAFRDNSFSNRATVMKGIVTPQLSTLPVTNINSESAISGGCIFLPEKVAVTECGVCRNTTGNPTILDEKSLGSIAYDIGSFSTNMTGLTLGTKYYVRAYATNSSGTAYGNEVVFTAKSAEPDVSTAAITSITNNSAISGGNITDIKESNVIARGLCWNTTGSPTISDLHTTENGTFGVGSFNASISDLALGTKYYVRAYATNASGTAYGNEMSFTTYNPENVNKMSFQGVITDNQGRMLNNGNYSITFKLYDSESDGSLVWSETRNVSVNRGMININLGEVNPITGLAFNTSYWLGITVGNTPELTPRTAVTGSAYPYGAVGQ